MSGIQEIFGSEDCVFQGQKRILQKNKFGRCQILYLLQEFYNLYYYKYIKYFHQLGSKEVSLTLFNPASVKLLIH